jgi:hypothetical protein
MFALIDRHLSSLCIKLSWYTREVSAEIHGGESAGLLSTQMSVPPRNPGEWRLNLFDKTRKVGFDRA